MSRRVPPKRALSYNSRKLWRATKDTITEAICINSPSTSFRSHLIAYITRRNALGLVELVDETHDGRFQNAISTNGTKKIINRHLANEREKDMEAGEKPMTADDIKLYFHEGNETALRDMLRKH